jgi:hypothetical protein
MKRISRISACGGVALALAAVVAGCGEEPEPTVEVDAARQGWRSTEVALASVGVPTGWSGSGSVGSDGVMAELMGSANCPEGGSATIDAAADVHADDVMAALSIEFDACAAEGVVIDGTLDYAASVTDTEVFASIHGDLDWSGDAEGRCEIHLEAKVTRGDASGTAVSVNGQMCGHRWQEVFAAGH